MSYVPIIVPPQQPPSPRTRELADELARVLRDFEGRHPSVTRHEVVEASRLALQASGTRSVMAPVLTAVLGLGVAALVALLVFVRSGGELSGAGSPVGAVVVGLAVVAAVIFIRRRNE